MAGTSTALMFAGFVALLSVFRFGSLVLLEKTNNRKVKVFMEKAKLVYASVLDTLWVIGTRSILMVVAT